MSENEKTIFSVSLWDVYQKEGRECLGNGDLEGARERFEMALEQALHYGANDPRVAITKRSIGEVCQKQGKFSEAEEFYQEALDLLETQLGEDSGVLLKTLKNYVSLLVETERRDEAADLKARVAKIESKTAEIMAASNIFEELVPGNADELPMTPQQRQRIVELLHREEVSQKLHDEIEDMLQQTQNYLWAHETQGRLRREIVESYQPFSPKSLRSKESQE